MDELLTLLKEDARTPVADLARQLNRSEDEIRAAMAAYESGGMIKGYQAILNEDLVEDAVRPVRAVIEVAVQPEREGGFDHIAARIARFPEVATMYLMSGKFDLLLHVEGNDLRRVASFVSEKLSTIPGVTSTTTHFMLKTYKYRGVQMTVEEGHERLKVSP